MRKWKERVLPLYRALGLTEDLDRAAQWIGLTGLFSVLTLILGLIWDKPHWAFVAAAASAALISATILLGLEIVQRLQAFRMINVVASSAVLIRQSEVAAVINASMVLLNSSRRTLFYRIRAAEMGLQGGVNTRGAPIAQNVENVLPMQPKPIALASLNIPQIPPAVDGYAKIVIEYGYEIGRLPYRLEYETGLEGAFPNVGGAVPLGGVTRTNEHARVALE